MPAAPRLAWPLIAALGAVSIIGYGTAFYGFSLLVGPVSAELGVSRQGLVGAFSLALLLWGLVSPAVGVLIDRIGGRELMTVASLVSGALFVALSRIESTTGFYLAWAAIGVMMAGTTYDPAFAVLTRVHQSRARRAMTMVTLIGGFASTVFWPLATFLIEHQGWRGACVTMGLMQCLLAAPLNWFVIRRDGAWRGYGDEAASRRTDGSASAGDASRAAADATPHAQATAPSPPRSTGLREAMSEPVFYWLAGTMIAYQFVFSATAVHLVPMMQARGLDAAHAAAIGAMLGPTQVVGRLAEMSFGSRLPIVQVGRVAVLMLPLSMGWYLVSPPSFGWLALFPLIYGAGMGIMTIVRGALPVELYGPQHYATISGALALPTVFATALGPVATAPLWSAQAGYDRIAIAMGVVGLVGAAFLHLAAGSRRALRSAPRHHG